MEKRKLYLGNCYLGVAVLAWRHHFRGRVVIRWLGRWIPHAYWRSEDGRLHHFRVVRDFMPDPLYFLAFIGEFHSSERG